MANYTLNYTGEKVDELLNKIDTAFGETTVMGDTLTWDGNTDGKVFVDTFGNGQQLFCLVSDVVPTIEDFTNGAKLGFGANGEIEIPASGVLPLGDGVLVESNFNFGIIPRDNMTVTVPYNGMTLSVTYPKKGIYFGKTVGVGYVSSLTINGYTGFEMVEITPIDPKYLPTGGVEIVNFTAGADGTTTGNTTFEQIKTMLSNGAYVVASVNALVAGAIYYVPVMEVKESEITFTIPISTSANVVLTITSDNDISFRITQ